MKGRLKMLEHESAKPPPALAKTMTLIFAATTGWTKPAQCSAKTADYIKLSKSPQIHIPPTGPGCSKCVGAHGRHEHARYCLADSGSSIFRRPFICLRLNLLLCTPTLTKKGRLKAYAFRRPFSIAKPIQTIRPPAFWPLF